MAVGWSSPMAPRTMERDGHGSAAALDSARPQFVRTRLPPQAADGPMLEQRVELFLDVLDTVRWTAVLVPMDTFGRNGGRRPEASGLRGVHAPPSPLHQRELA